MRPDATTGVATRFIRDADDDVQGVEAGQFERDSASGDSPRRTRHCSAAQHHRRCRRRGRLQQWRRQDFVTGGGEVRYGSIGV